MNSSPASTTAAVARISGYRQQFETLFGEVSFENICRALACFERDVESGKLKYLETLANDATLDQLSGAAGVAISPDGATLAGAGEGKAFKLWELATGTELHSLVGHQGAVTSLAFSPDGTALASGSTDKTIRLWDVASGEAIQTFNGHTNGVDSVVFTPDESQIISGSADGTFC